MARRMESSHSCLCSDLWPWDALPTSKYSFTGNSAGMALGLNWKLAWSTWEGAGHVKETSLNTYTAESMFCSTHRTHLSQGLNMSKMLKPHKQRPIRRDSRVPLVSEHEDAAVHKHQHQHPPP
jgi:hypothetical protein